MPHIHAPRSPRHLAVVIGGLLIGFSSTNVWSVQQPSAESLKEEAREIVGSMRKQSQVMVDSIFTAINAEGDDDYTPVTDPRVSPGMITLPDCDINGDGVVNVDDLLLVIAAWGRRTRRSRARQQVDSYRLSGLARHGFGRRPGRLRVQGPFQDCHVLLWAEVSG